jgi:hypothetical protein
MPIIEWAAKLRNCYQPADPVCRFLISLFVVPYDYETFPIHDFSPGFFCTSYWPGDFQE